MKCDFTKEELDLLANGFGYFSQEFNFNAEEEEAVSTLLNKLYRLSDEAEHSKAVVTDAP